MQTFAYNKPASLADAARAAGGAAAKIRAGGQSLLAAMTLGLAAPGSVRAAQWPHFPALSLHRPNGAIRDGGFDTTITVI